MLRCPKCKSTYTEAGKICRSCGAILEEVPQEDSTTTRLIRDAAAAEWIQEAAPQELSQTAAPAALISDDAGCPADEWICPGCGEACPNNFAVCWNCGIDSQDVHGVVHRPLASEVEATSQPDEPEPIFDPPNTRPSRLERAIRSLRCSVCGSDKIIPDVPVVGGTDGGQLHVVVCGDPGALIFKDRRVGRCTANICGDCGHMHLHVENPEELYDHYLHSRK
jgi:hypothetical protein